MMYDKMTMLTKSYERNQVEILELKSTNTKIKNQSDLAEDVCKQISKSEDKNT